MQHQLKTYPFIRLAVLTLIIGFIVPSVAMMPKSNTDGTIKKVVIDAGHGGKDTGNLGTGRYKHKEKDISLEVALKVGNYIKQNFPEIEVIYTRTDDNFVELRERTAMANRNEADLFISIHCNAHTTGAAYGTETFVMGLTREKANLELAKRENSVILMEDDYEKNYEGFDPNDPQGAIAAQISSSAFLDQSLRLAMYIEDEFANRVQRSSRGVKQSVLYVLDFSAMPSVLIELGFLSNRSEEDFLNTTEGKDLMASAIYRAFKQYKLDADEIDRLNKIDEPAPKPTPTPKKEEPKKEVPKTTPNTTTPQKPANTTTTPPVAPVVNKPTESDRPVYRIQLTTSNKKIEPTPANFNGLSDISFYEQQKIFKYTYGNFKTLDEANAALPAVRAKGYTTAFVIAWYKGNRISIKEAAEITP